jgi:hypothetical protein
MKGYISKAKKYNPRHTLTSAEKNTIVQYILDLDSQRFPPRIKSAEDMANLLLKTRGAKPIGVNWASRFVRRRPELKTRFSRAYDFQRALYEDPELLKRWFELVKNIRMKYSI